MATAGWANDPGDAREISLCWLVHALLSVARRVRSVSASAAGLPLLSVAARDRKATVLPALLRAIQQQPDGHDETDAPSLSVHSLTAIETLSSSLENVAGEARVVVICVEAEDDSDSDSWRHVLEELQPHGGSASEPPLAWIAVAFSCATPAGLSLRVAVHGSLSIDTVSLETAAQPLHELREQCGLPLALELLAKLTREPPRRDASASASLLAMPVASHLPFQLLAMLLRWSYFHPRVVATLGRPFWRKLALIPQPRVRHEIETLYTSHARIWQEMYPDSAALHALHMKAPSSVSTQLRLPFHTDDGETHEDEDTLPPLQRLSQCTLWDKQKQFYRDQGIRAWSTHLIPFGVSSSSYLARQYARLAVDFLVHTVSATPAPLRSVSPQQPRTPNCFVWEAASGSCKFLHTFLLHFYALVERDRLEDRLGLVPCVVATDLSEQVLRSREDMACFQRYLQDGRLDFAAFDTDIFLPRATQNDDSRGVLWLRHSGIRWRVGQERGPVFIIGNYFFDSLRSDVFVVTQRQADGSDDGSSGRAVEIREARIDPTTDSIPDMLFSLATLPDHPRHVPVYEDALTNATLVATLDRLQAHWTANETASVAGGGHSSLMLFPVEAIAFLNAVLSDESSFPVAVVTGDATFSFLDAVPSAFIDEHTGDLEIPQLSPHPDCFCLPVDLEILQLAARQQQHGSASVVSSPTSDTFNVFFAQSSLVNASSREALARRFHEVFDRFTPSDCDLIWGLLRVDGGATQLSPASQMALLAQTAWDFDVFATVQWKLVHQWKQQIKELELTQGSGLEKSRVVAMQRDRQRLVFAGQRSFDTFYVMDETARSEAAAVTRLQLARWFYELRAFTQAKAVLEMLDVDRSGVRVAATYLLGLIAYQQQDLWTALTWFRKGQQLEPNRLRLAKWVARTLIRLQETTQQRQSEMA